MLLTVTAMKKLFIKTMMSEDKMAGLFNLPKAGYADQFYLENLISPFRRAYRNDRTDATLSYSIDPHYEYLAEQDLRGFNSDFSESASEGDDT